MACAQCGKEKWQHIDQRLYTDASVRPALSVYSFNCQVEYLKKGIPTEVHNPYAIGKGKK